MRTILTEVSAAALWRNFRLARDGNHEAWLEVRVIADAAAGTPLGVTAAGMLVLLDRHMAASARAEAPCRMTGAPIVLGDEP